ncbi:hypothetical protein L596_013480 [Steinernema carpocapsae]|uniref:Uncharacterized protein n=1 Tax=Steinernema carpocapsae TaxID=34508 RepID=A0A4U5P159_STECR|nr:hypothetical protein L596_013480 [Steinernema carpocapsae]
MASHVLLILNNICPLKICLKKRFLKTKKLIRRIFRKSRWKLRMRLEEEDEFIAFRRSFTETEDRLHVVRTRQIQLKNQLLLLNEHINHLTTIVSANSNFYRSVSEDTATEDGSKNKIV